jgi:FKBP-type peptidyl-prolyl cis-trans isomerase FklB
MRTPAAALLALLVISIPAAAVDAPARKWTRGESRAWLAEHRSRPGVVATRSGLQYRIVEEGAGCRPKPKSVVKVSYQLRLGDEAAIVDDSAKLGGAVGVPLSEMIPAWKEGIPLMREGATWEFIVPPALAYGEQGNPPAVPAHAPLVFRVTLVKAPYCADAPAPTPSE